MNTFLTISHFLTISQKGFITSGRLNIGNTQNHFETFTKTKRRQGDVEFLHGRTPQTQ